MSQNKSATKKPLATQRTGEKLTRSKSTGQRPNKGPQVTKPAPPPPTKSSSPPDFNRLVCSPTDFELPPKECSDVGNSVGKWATTGFF